MGADKPVWPRELLASPHDTPDKASRVRRMFNAISPRYELINSLFSVGCDAMWRRRAVKLACVRDDDDVLDIACGTGDFARAFAGAVTIVLLPQGSPVRCRFGGFRNPLRIRGLQIVQEGDRQGGAWHAS